MSHKRSLLFSLILLGLFVCFSPVSHAQLWNGILSPTYGSGACTLVPSSSYAGCGVDWQDYVGVPGGIPSGSWSQCTTGSCATVNAAGVSATCSQINAALQQASSSSQQYVLLASGTYSSLGDCSITIPKNAALRGAGANLTILNQSNTSGPVIALGGTNEMSSSGAVSITGGATAGSTSITVSSASGMSAGQLMMISELNNPAYVDTCGDEGCGTWNYCVYNWGEGGGSSRTRCQEVMISSVSGSTVNFNPPLVTAFNNTLPGWTASNYYGLYQYITVGGHYYGQQANISGSPYHCQSGSKQPAFPTNGGTVSDGNCTWQDEGSGTTTQPQAVASAPSAIFAGVENLQIYDNKLVSFPDIFSAACAYCWVKGVEVNYTNADWVTLDQSFRNEVRDSYFTNAYNHTSGAYDSTVNVEQGAANNLIENNIMERGHIGGVMLERGVTSNVIAYNFVTGAFDGTDFWNIDALDYHGAHPQFNLAEGNVWNMVHGDNVWGSESHHTSFRNWDTGYSYMCAPFGLSQTRTSGNCSPSGYPSEGGKNSWNSFQVAGGSRMDYAAIGFNIIGDVVGSSTAQALVNASNSSISQATKIVWQSGANVQYGGSFYGLWFGLATTGDTGSFPLDSQRPYTTALLHGIYSNVDGSTTWQSGLTQSLPPSFFLTGKPSWWTSGIPWPAIGPDVSGGPGGQGYGSFAANPAQNCYYSVMGGAGSETANPLTFNANNCYTSVTLPNPPSGLSATVN
jgi:hypothetical protein